MSELHQLIKMLVHAEIHYELDEKTYPNRIVIRVYKYSSASFFSEKLETIFDFDLFGNLISIG